MEKRMNLELGLSRALWIIIIGIFLNNLGYGAVLPFEVIYLHDGRGFSVGTAGLVIGLITGVAVLISPVAGTLIDRFGARTMVVVGGMALTIGYAGLAFAATPALACVAAAVAGAGNGVLNPSQTTLVAVLAPQDSRHRVTAVSRVAANAGIGIGGALGGLVAAFGLNGFVSLYLFNAVTYLIFVLVLAAVVRQDARPQPTAGGYRSVVRDRTFMRLALTNIAIIGVGWGVFTWLMPPYADQIGFPPQLVGLLLFANATTVVIAQIPISRFAEGRRRAVMMAFGALIFVFACLLVAGVGSTEPNIAYFALLGASISVAIGECFHTTVLMPLVADIAPVSLRGRYMAAIGLSWWVGLALAPAVGGQLLGLAPTAAFVTAAGVALLAAISALTLEQSIPAAFRLTPRPQRVEVAASAELE
jgi:MFS family permease